MPAHVQAHAHKFLEVGTVGDTEVIAWHPKSLWQGKTPRQETTGGIVNSINAE